MIVSILLYCRMGAFTRQSYRGPEGLHMWLFNTASPAAAAAAGGGGGGGTQCKRCHNAKVRVGYT